MNIHGRDRADLLQTFEWAVRDVAAGRAVDVGPLLRGSAVEGRLRVEALAHTLEFGSYTDVDFGPLRPDYRAALNAIRTEEGVPLIEGDSLIIPASVARKLYEKRILQEGMGRGGQDAPGDVAVPRHNGKELESCAADDGKAPGRPHPAGAAQG